LAFAGHDLDKARKMAATLQESGVDVWFDYAEKQTKLDEAAVLDRLSKCAVFLPIFSAPSMANVFFRRECQLALETQTRRGAAYPLKIWPARVTKIDLRRPGLVQEFNQRKLEFADALEGELEAEQIEEVQALVKSYRPAPAGAVTAPGALPAAAAAGTAVAATTILKPISSASQSPAPNTLRPSVPPGAPALNLINKPVTPAAPTIINKPVTPAAQTPAAPGASVISKPVTPAPAPQTPPLTRPATPPPGSASVPAPGLSIKPTVPPLPGNPAIPAAAPVVTPQITRPATPLPVQAAPAAEPPAAAPTPAVQTPVQSAPAPAPETAAAEAKPAKKQTGVVREAPPADQPDPFIGGLVITTLVLGTIAYVVWLLFL